MTTLHPDVQRLLDVVRLAGRLPVQDLTPAEARTQYRASRSVLQPPPQHVAETRDVAIEGPAGPIPARLYRGAGTPVGLLPALLFLHGGGWVVGDLESHDGVCRRLANLGGCWVLAVDYRLAPEHPFPAAVEDSAAALRWLAAEASARSASTRPASPWRATARAATWPPCWR